MKTIDMNLSPLMGLKIHIRRLFSQGNATASMAASRLIGVCMMNQESSRQHFDVSLPTFEIPVTERLFPWNSCKLAASIVLIHAAAPHETFEALKFHSRSLGGLPKLGDIRSNASASLENAFKRAKERAVGPEHSTTVLGVSLVDVNILEQAKAGASDGYTSFSHAFTMAAGPEGVVIWQSWGEDGYSLDEYLQRDGDRLRTWEEADKFVDDFDKLTKRGGPWSAKINRLYKRCFEVDVLSICGPKGSQKPIVPKFEAWVRLHEITDVKWENIGKFAWRIHNHEARR